MHGIRVNSIHPGYIWGDKVEWYLGYLGEQRGKTGEEMYDELAGETCLKYLPHSERDRRLGRCSSPRTSPSPSPGRASASTAGTCSAEGDPMIKLVCFLKRKPAD